MNDTIKDLYYGNISPIEKPIENDGDYKELLHQSTESLNELTESLSDSQKVLLDDYIDKTGKANLEIEFHSFLDGFRIGCRLIHEALSDSNP